MLTVKQIARRIPWLVMGLILAGALLHFFGPAELERAELIVIGALIVGLICFQVWLRRRSV
jgi:Flp pilus assembly protein protease CpaA